MYHMKQNKGTFLWFWGTELRTEAQVKTDAFSVFLCYLKSEFAKADSNELKFGLGFCTLCAFAPARQDW